MSKKNVCPDRRRRHMFGYRYLSQCIDESANQEAPSLQEVLESVASTSTFIPTGEYSKKGSYELGSTISSGYFSTSSQTSQPIPDATDSCSEQKHFRSDKSVPQPLRRVQSNIQESRSRRAITKRTWNELSEAFLQIHSSESPSSPRSEPFADSTDAGSRHTLLSTGIRFTESPPRPPSSKKARLTHLPSPFASSPSQLPDDNLDDTLSISDGGNSDDGNDKSVLSTTSCSQGHESDLSSDERQVSPPQSPQPESPLASRYPFFRCASVPAHAVQERLDTSDALSSFKPSILPVIERTGEGVNFISVDTMAHLLTGKYSSQKIDFLVVDCRFPYEYNGGHVKAAVNIYAPSDLLREVFNRIPALSGQEDNPFISLNQHLEDMLAKPNPSIRLPTVGPYARSGFSSDEGGEESEDSILVDDPFEEKGEEELDTEASTSVNVESVPEPSDISVEEVAPHTNYAIIFHCEFSSQRAPTMAKFLRKMDRTSNCNRYPFLYYPHLYVMKGGYSEFYKRYPHLCEPSKYMKMFHKGHRSDLRYYRRLTKQIFDSCSACFCDLHLVNLADLSCTENKENQEHRLRKVHTMYERKSSSPLHSWNIEAPKLRFDGESPFEVEPNDVPSPKKYSPDEAASTIPPETSSDSSEPPERIRLRLAEALVRVGDHVTSVFARGRSQSLRSSSLSARGSSALQRGLLTADSPTPASSARDDQPRIRVMPLSFSSSDESEPNSP